MPNDIQALAESHGGYWSGQHHDYPLTDWQREVSNGDTRLGYWEWLRAILDGEICPVEH